MLRDMNQAMNVLLGVKHWSLKCVNSDRGRRHECTVWNDSRRVTASRHTPLEAIQAAFDKLGIADKAGSVAASDDDEAVILKFPSNNTDHSSGVTDHDPEPAPNNDDPRGYSEVGPLA